MAIEVLAVAFTILITIATSLLIGRYMFLVFTGGRTLLDSALVPIERLVLRATGVDANQRQDWKQYSVSLLISNVVMWLATWTIVTFQNALPLNPAKYFAIIPAMFILAFPQLGVLKIMSLATPESAILSAVIFNAVIIIALIPLAMKGIDYKPLGAAANLRRNLLIYGVGGVLLPFAGIKAIDMVLVTIGLA